jgi:hypothetical protein
MVCASATNPVPTFARVWRVPDDVQTIAAALDSAAVADSVQIACGTYIESDLVLKPGITLRSETGRAECVTLDAKDLAGHIYMADVDSTTRVEGITFTRGWGAFTGVTGAFGGAIRIENGASEIRDCVFRSNSAVYGGAIAILGGSLAVERCIFEQNDAVGDGAISAMGGYVSVDSCTFTENTGFEGSGAIWVRSPGSLDVRDSRFLRNSTAEEGGAISVRQGAPLLAEGCVFEDNVSRSGAGAVEGHDIRLIRCEFHRNGSRFGGGAVGLFGGSHHIVDCAFTRNTSMNYGGAIRSRAAAGDSSLVEGCTFYANDADLFGASIAVLESAHVTVNRSILAFGMGGGAIYLDPNSSTALSCTDIYGNVDGDWAGPLSSQAHINGNFSLDPRFCAPDEGNLALHQWSPCLPAYSPCGEQVGTFGLGCEATTTPVVLASSGLLPNYPNPFNPSTTIRFQLAHPAQVRLMIFDLRGRRIRALLDEDMTAGAHRIQWSGVDDHRRSVGSGVYVLELQVGKERYQQKLTLIR